MDEIRVDKWLWAVRIYKTRNLASDACRAGKIKIKENTLKPSYIVKVGDVFEITIEQLKKTIEVKALLSNRVSAKLVSDYVIDHTPPEEYERIKMARQFNFEKREKGLGRPTKKERRNIEDFKYL